MNNGHPKMSALSLGTVNITLQRKGFFEEMIKLRDLTWGDYPRLFGGP